MKKKTPRRVTRTRADILNLERQNSVLTRAVAELRNELSRERIQNAPPVLRITAEPEHLLIVACAGLGMKVRTQSVTVASSKK